MAAMGLQETFSFLITIFASVVCVRVRLGRELIIPSLGVDYSDLWDTVVKNSSAPSSHLNPRHGDRVMYMCAAELAVPSPLLLCATLYGAISVRTEQHYSASIGGASMCPPACNHFCFPVKHSTLRSPHPLTRSDLTPPDSRGWGLLFAHSAGGNWAYTRGGETLIFIGSLQKSGLVSEAYLCPLCSSSSVAS